MLMTDTTRNEHNFMSETFNDEILQYPFVVQTSSAEQTVLRDKGSTEVDSEADWGRREMPDSRP